ncbi:MAG: putative transposase [Bacillota bacterium]|jgi:hypothetical protein
MIYVDHRLLMSYQIGKKRTDERVALVLLVMQGVIGQRQLAKAFGVHYNTINNWVRDYVANGVQGLIPRYANEPLALRPGPVQDMAELEEPAVKIEEGAQTSLWVDSDCGDSEECTDQFERVSLAECVPPMAGASCEMETETETEPDGISVDAGEAPYEATALLPEEPQVSTTSRYVGLMLIVPFLQAMLQPLFEYLRRTSRRFHTADKMWSVWDLLQAWALLIFQGVENPEQTKALVHSELGVLFGRRRFLSCKTLRRSWPLLVANGLPKVSGKFLARRLIRLGYVTLGTIYLDGHFVPYFGKSRLYKGWWPQRRSAFRGHYQHWANDMQGRPIFCLMHQAYTYFGHIIPEMVKWLRLQMQATGAVSPLILVFDRGAYSGPLFNLLDQMDVGWITYRKGSEQYPEDDFTFCMKVTHLAGRERRVEYCHKSVPLDTYDPKTISALALRDPDTGQQVTVICNDEVITKVLGRPMTAEEKITSVTARWRQENFFREAKVHTDIDGILGYDFDLVRADTTHVPNPAHAKLLTRIEALETALDRWEQKHESIAARYEALKSKPSWSRYLEQKGNQKITARYQAITRQLANTRQELANTPDTVAASELDDREMATLRFERQQTMMSLRLAVYHARHQLRSLIAKYHSDHREIGKVLERLMHGGGTYTTGTTVDIVTLTRPEQPRFQRTAERLIENLNAMHPKALGDGSKALVFRLKD